MTAQSTEKRSMIPGNLYVCSKDTRITGTLQDGTKAFSILTAGTPVMPIMNKNQQAIMASGVLIGFNWDTPGWWTIFEEVQGDAA